MPLGAVRTALTAAILGAYVLPQTPGRAQTPAGPLISTDLAPIARSIGPWVARVRVRVEDGRVIDATFESAPPGTAALIAPVTEAYVRTWVFAPGSSATFVTTIQVSHDKNHVPCASASNPNFVVNARIPTSIEFITRPHTFCDPTTTINIGSPITVRAIEGYVRCDCRGRAPIEGSTIGITAPSFERRVRSDDRGYFRLGGVPPGTYTARIDADGHYGREFQLTVSPSARPASMDVRLRKAPPAAPLPPGPEAVVATARLADYPAALRAAGKDGVVRIRLSAAFNEVIDVDVDSAVPELARAAEENVRTWKFSGLKVPVLRVTYTYRLLPGDCGTDQEPTVTMRFPHTVEVAAKRPIKCER